MIELFTTAWTMLNENQMWSFVKEHKCKKEQANVVMKMFGIEGKNKIILPIDCGVVILAISPTEHCEDFNKMCIEEIENEIKTNYPKLYGSYKKFKEERKITLSGRRYYGKID